MEPLTIKRSIICTILLGVGLMSISCEGPMGPEGPQGPKGEQGPPGPVGPAGTDGSIIHAGMGAPEEPFGKPGDFYLDLSNGYLYGPKMAEGWGAPFSLIGENGPEGPEGPQGPPGEDGEDGQDGKNGEDGKDGQDGKDGSRIYAGSGPPGNNLGKKGDYYLDRDNYDLYGPKTGDGWGTPVNLQGPAGSADVTSYLFTDLEWVGNANAIVIFYDEDFNIPEDVQEEGMILFYVRFDVPPGTAGAGWWPAPASYVNIDGETYSIAAAYGNAGINLLLRNPDGSQIPADQEVINVAALRVIVVPPGKVIPAKIPSNFWEDYEAVAKYFGIQERS